MTMECASEAYSIPTIAVNSAFFWLTIAEDIEVCIPICFSLLHYWFWFIGDSGHGTWDKHPDDVAQFASGVYGGRARLHLMHGVRAKHSAFIEVEIQAE